MVLSRGIDGARARLETVFAHTDSFRVVLESSNGLRVTPEINKSFHGTTLTLLES
jgi:hypothetical protein